MAKNPKIEITEDATEALKKIGIDVTKETNQIGIGDEYIGEHQNVYFKRYEYHFYRKDYYDTTNTTSCSSRAAKAC